MLTTLVSSWQAFSPGTGRVRINSSALWRTVVSNSVGKEGASCVCYSRNKSPGLTCKVLDLPHSLKTWLRAARGNGHVYGRRTLDREVRSRVETRMYVCWCHITTAQVSRGSPTLPVTCGSRSGHLSFWHTDTLMRRKAVLCGGDRTLGESKATGATAWLERL